MPSSARKKNADHAKGVKVLCEKLGIPFYASFGTARKMDWLEHPLWSCIYDDKTESIGKLAVLPFVFPHDAEAPMYSVSLHDALPICGDTLKKILNLETESPGSRRRHTPRREPGL